MFDGQPDDRSAHKRASSSYFNGNDSGSPTDGRLNKAQLAGIIAEEHELSIAKSQRIVNSVFDTIAEVRIDWRNRWSYAGLK